MFDTFYLMIWVHLPTTDTTDIESDDQIYLTWSHLTGIISGKYDHQDMRLLKYNVVNNYHTSTMRLRGGMNPNIKKDLFAVYTRVLPSYIYMYIYIYTALQYR